MNLISFLEPWANPSGYIKVYDEKEYQKAVLMIASGDATWSNVTRQLEAELVFNPRACDFYSFLRPKFTEADVVRYVIVENSLLVFLKFDKGSKQQ